MANRRPTYSVSSEALSPSLATDPFRELFEACKIGDINKVKKLINSQTVNARDTAGRKSTPLHFAAGIRKSFDVMQCIICIIQY